MDFDFSPDQKYLQQEAHSFLSDRCGRKSARQVLESNATYDSALWKQIAELGWTGINIPECYGGLGLGPLFLCVVAEELGRFLAPVPFSSSIYMAAEALTLFGSKRQKEKWLPKIASGELIATFGGLDRAAGSPPKQAPVIHANGCLSGEISPVPDGSCADIAIVAAADADKPAGRPNLFLVELNSASVRRKTLNTIDPSRDYARLGFDAAPAELLELPRGEDSIRAIADRAAILLAFEQLGGADVCLDTATEFVKQRHAFGREVGSYQAVKHKLADMYVNNQIARSNCHYGAWALSADETSLAMAACLSRISATQAYAFAARESLHLHGAMGFAWETDCHMYYRRAKQLGLLLGAERQWKERMIALIDTMQPQGG